MPFHCLTADILEVYNTLANTDAIGLASLDSNGVSQQIFETQPLTDRMFLKSC